VGTTIVLTEQALGDADAVHLAELHDASPEGTEQEWVVLVPADPKRSLLADVLDHLSLLELRGALGAVRHHEDPSRKDAQTSLEASLAELGGLGLTVQGEVVVGDAVAALAAAVTKYSATDVVIVTRPHAVEDTLHTDWASKARERLGVPVLHVYAGSTWLG
jgi:hypothetical protein